MTTRPAITDRAAALRSAVRSVVARRGLHGASVSQIAAAAGVATGTAYVHYTDKDDLVVAAYVEAKLELGRVAVAAAGAVWATGDLEAAFRAVWLAAYRHLREDPDVAAFLLQIDASPLAHAAHDRVLHDGGDALRLTIGTSGLGDRMRDLPPEVLYELGLAPAVRLAARGVELTDAQLHEVADGCWAAVTA